MVLSVERENRTGNTLEYVFPSRNIEFSIDSSQNSLHFGTFNQDPDHWAGSYDQNASLGTAEGRSMDGIVGSDAHRDHRIRFVKKIISDFESGTY